MLEIDPEKKQPKVKNIVEIFGRKLERTEQDISEVVHLLNENWVVHVNDWRKLSEKAKKAVGLPAMLVDHLESFCK